MIGGQGNSQQALARDSGNEARRKKLGHGAFGRPRFEAPILRRQSRTGDAIALDAAGQREFAQCDSRALGFFISVHGWIDFRNRRANRTPRLGPTGGDGGIRTRERASPSAVFKTAAERPAGGAAPGIRLSSPAERNPLAPSAEARCGPLYFVRTTGRGRLLQFTGRRAGGAV